MSRYESPGGFWADLLTVCEAQRRNQLAPPDVVRRMQAHDESYGGPARRGVGTAGLGALIPEVPVTEAAWGVPTTRRPLVDALIAGGGEVPMPETGMVLTVPSSLTAGVVAASQTAENFGPAGTALVYLSRTSPIVTIMTSLEVSRQAFDRGADMEGHLTRMCRAAVDAELERQVIGGSGASGELAGLIMSASYVSLSATFAHNVVRSTAQASRLVAEAAKVPARIVTMHPRRWQHISADVLNSSTSWNSVSWSPPGIGSVPVIQSGAIPTTLGTATNEDRILSLIPGVSCVLAVDAPRVQVAAAPLGGQGTVRLLVSQYAGLVTRTPTMIQCVSGAGLVAPAAFG